MKKHIKTTGLMVMLMLLLASCSDVFYSGIAGTVYDADNRSTGISGVQVYGYTSESARDAAYNGYLADSSQYKNASTGDFIDKSCLYRASTNAQGSWTISKIVWDTKDSAWGKDFDHTSVYLLYFSEEIGIQKSQSPIEVVSSASNTNAVSAYFEKLMKDHSVTISFKDGNSGNNITDDMTLTYFYDNGYVTKTNQVTVQNGILNLTLAALKEKNGVAYYPTLYLENINIPDAGWKFDGYDAGETFASILINQDSIKKQYELDRLKTTFNITVNFKETLDGTNMLNTNVTDSLKCKYSYQSEKDSFGHLKERTAEVTVSGGVFTLSLSVNLDDIVSAGETPALYLYDFTDVSECWDVDALNALNSDAGIKIDLDAAKTDIRLDQMVKRLQYDLGSGVSGTVSIMSTKLGVSPSPDSLDGLTVELSLDGGTSYQYQVLTESGDYSNKDAKRFSTTFSNLGSDVKVPVSGTNVLTVRCEGKTVELDLQKFFAQKNNVAISLD